MINVVIFSAGPDTGNQGYAIKRAFDRYQADFSVRSICTFDGYFHYSSDLSNETARTQTLMEAADIIHLRNSFGGYKRFNKTGRPVGLVIHHHGTKFRNEHAALAAASREFGATQIASTIDLVLLEPDVVWLPAPFDLDALALLRSHEQCSLCSPLLGSPHTVRIAHAPTSRELKSTNLIMAAVQKLSDKGLPVVFDLIERRSYQECLERKAKADILVDQLHLGYGNNAIEAWAMGIPVVAGVDNDRVREGMVSMYGSLPFYEANEANLAERLEELIVDARTRVDWGNKGLRYVQTYHDERIVAGQLAAIYRASFAAGRVD
jgi:hypothetical protein